MTSWVALSSKAHANHGWKQNADYGFAAAQQLVPVLMAELSAVIAQYVLCFVPTENNAYQATAILSADGKSNVYVDAKGRWLTRYIPAQLRGYPFALHDGQENQKVLCINKSALSEEAGSLPLFDSNGELDKKVADILKFMTECEKSKATISAATAELANAGLIVPWDNLVVKQADKQKPIKLDGLYRIDEKALTALNTENFAGLRKHGAIALAYAQLFSINQLSQLGQLTELRRRLSPEQAPEKLDSLFGSDDAGSINFDSI
ncbi:MAG: SapC family protein [Pseudohongiella nitratireducens]|nr:SapC family protein [Pseudohongiella nitratireducens]MDF1621973.1 SapC family protein [Pseudohongiella nitratireducens]